MNEQLNFPSFSFIVQAECKKMKENVEKSSSNMEENYGTSRWKMEENYGK